MNPSESDITKHDDDHEGYLLEVHEVAQLLGVTRTRVSQLTSSGHLSFERRRVGTRNRLFYKRSEVLSHQKGYYGRHVAQPAISDSEQQFSARTQIQPDSKRAGARATAHSAEQSTGTQDTQSSTVFFEDNLRLSHEPSLEKIVHLLLQIQKSTMRAPTAPRTSATQQLEDDKNRALVSELIENVQRLSTQLSVQAGILASLLDESRSVKKELHRLQQYARAVGATTVQPAAPATPSASDVECPSGSRRSKAPRWSRPVPLKRRDRRL